VAKTEVSDRQKPVLEGIEAGKKPADIAKEMGISVNGVHGHIRRLRAAGALPKAKARANGGAKTKGAAKRTTSARKPSSNGRRAVSRSNLSPVVTAMRKAHEKADKRVAEIDSQIAKLTKEREQIVAAREG
jgi:predicted transcriptional regulator